MLDADLPMGPKNAQGGKPCDWKNCDHPYKEVFYGVHVCLHHERLIETACNPLLERPYTVKEWLKVSGFRPK